MKKIIFLYIYVAVALSLRATSSAANSQYPLEFPNYLGNIENIHPKVLFFEDGWHGYNFWKAYTPYPLGSISAENPCIAVSNDGYNWTVPEGLENPLAFAPDGGYNSDTHLVYNADTDELECWYRAYDIETVTDYILRRVSSDGVEWGAPEVVMPAAESRVMRLSPCVWIENDRYRMIYSNGNYLFTTDASPDDWQWSEPVRLNVPTTLHIWHQDVLVDPDSGAVEVLFTAYDNNGNNNAADLYYAVADSLFGEFCSPEMIIQRSSDPMAFDHRAIYRASMVKVHGEYYVYYSCIDRDWHRYMMLSTGSPIQDIVGFNPAELGVEAVEVFDMQVVVACGVITITAAAGSRIIVADISGRVMANLTADRAAVAVQPGIYVVKVNHRVVTVAVK